jgi:hypothetical protein
MSCGVSSPPCVFGEARKVTGLSPPEVRKPEAHNRRLSPLGFGLANVSNLKNLFNPDMKASRMAEDTSHPEEKTFYLC